MTVTDIHESHSNTLIITDFRLLHPENSTLLEKTINTLKRIVSELNIQEKIHSCLQILHFKSFRRILLIFSSGEMANLVHEYLTKFEIKVGFARKDNSLTHCTLDSECLKLANQSHSSALTDNKLNPDNVESDSPIVEKYPGIPTFNDKLQPPNPPIQMQSPPPSPYEGWISRPEEPPCDTTLGFHPKNLSHLLYTKTDNGNETRRVFSSFIDNEMSDSGINSELKDFNLGTGMHDEETNDLHGSLFQNPVLPQALSNKNNENIYKIPKSSKLKVPILIVDAQEAEDLRAHANKMDNKC